MENASKALIIAGSILIAITIIALGVKIFGKAKTSTGVSDNLDQTEIMAFNKQWEKYEGTKSGSKVNELVDALISNANTNQDEYIKLLTIKYKKSNQQASKTTISAKNKNYITNIENIKNVIISTNTYSITLMYNSTTGLVSTISIIPKE